MFALWSFLYSDVSSSSVAWFERSGDDGGSPDSFQCDLFFRFLQFLPARYQRLCRFPFSANFTILQLFDFFSIECRQFLLFTLFHCGFR